jgi:hypothetical protein
MKEKAAANAQEDAQAEATALAAAQEAAQLIAMDLEEGEVSDENMSTSTSSDSEDEGVLGTSMELLGSATPGFIQPESHNFDQEQQSLTAHQTPHSPTVGTGNKGKKRKQSPSTSYQPPRQLKATAKKQRRQARKASMAATSKSQPATKAKKAKKAKKTKKSKASSQHG